jgi:hypothetical protein
MNALKRTYYSEDNYSLQIVWKKNELQKSGVDAYTANNPIKFIDIDGNEPGEPQTSDKPAIVQPTASSVAGRTGSATVTPSGGTANLKVNISSIVQPPKPDNSSNAAIVLNASRGGPIAVGLAATAIVLKLAYDSKTANPWNVPKEEEKSASTEQPTNEINPKQKPDNRGPLPPKFGGPAAVIGAIVLKGSELYYRNNKTVNPEPAPKPLDQKEDPGVQYFKQSNVNRTQQNSGE